MVCNHLPVVGYLGVFKILFIYFRQRGREGKEKEGNINVWLPLTHLYWGPGLKPRHVPWLGMEPATLWFAARAQSTEPHRPGLVFRF